MISTLLKILMAFLATSPLLLFTFFFKSLFFLKFLGSYELDGDIYWFIFIITLILSVFIYIILYFAFTKAEIHNIAIDKWQLVNYRIKGLIITYLIFIPLLVYMHFGIVLFTYIAFTFIIYINKFYYYNPIFKLFGYNYYEIIINNKNYILVSKKEICDIKNIKNVIIIDDYYLISI